MSRIFQTEIMCYRKNWRGRLFNNEYYYISDNNYEIYERTLKLDEMPIWYNNIRNNLYRNGNSKLDIIYENNIEPSKLVYNSDYIYNNNIECWIIPDNTLMKNMVIASEILDVSDINNYANLILQNYNYSNSYELINSIQNTINTELNI